MEKVCEKKYCTGCTACYTVCPKNAITMVEDKEGFIYPIINQDKCIDCGLCKKTCPVLSTKENESINQCYAAYNKNEKELEQASSGAIFSIIAEQFIEDKGIVIGAAFDENNKLIHKAVYKKKDLESLKGSKYIQSDLGDVFKYIKENVKDNKILFVGTPCQVAGLKRVVNNDNLFCIDIVCHGVPSALLFKKYLEELETNHKEKIIGYKFRDKNPNWENYSNTIIFKDKKVTENSKNNIYMNIFLNDIALRKSCYNCNFKLGNKYSDITLGDFWGIKEKHKDMYNEKGVSAIIINTSNGQKMMEIIKDSITFKECKLEEIVSGNPSLKESAMINIKRGKIYKNINKYNLEKLYKKYSQNKYSRINKIISRILKKHL